MNGWGLESPNRGNLAEDLDPQEREGAIVGEDKRKRGGTTIGTCFSAHPQTLEQKGTSCAGYRDGCKPPQPSQTLELGMAGHHSRSLWPQLPKGSPMQKTLQPSDPHCHHPPGKAHALTLPKALGAIPTFLRVTATTKRPAIMSSLLHPPLHGSSLLAKAPATKYCLQGIPIVPPLWKHMQTIHLQTPYQGVTAYTH